MTRFSAALAAGSTAFVLLLTGCGADDPGDSADSGQSAAATSSAPPADNSAPDDSAAVDNAKASMFVIAYRNAFPELAEGREDGEIAGILTTVCGAIGAGEPQEATVAEIIERTGSAATTDEARAIYTTAQYMC